MYGAALINDPFGDPGVYVECRYRHESLLFDLGDVHRLPPRKLLKVDYIFVSHTHMDHFIGFTWNAGTVTSRCCSIWATCTVFRPASF